MGNCFGKSLEKALLNHILFPFGCEIFTHFVPKSKATTMASSFHNI